jgi:CheY-like chemotaxis protein
LLRQLSAFLDAYAVVHLGVRRVSISIHSALYVRRIAAIFLQRKSSKLCTIEQTAFASGTILCVRVGRKSQKIEGNKKEQVVAEGAMTRILLVDDHKLMRQQLRQTIQKREQWEVCGEAADGPEAVYKHSVLKPHLTVMDYHMPLLDGLQAARLILKQHPSARILMITVSASRQLMEEVKKAGLKGFCSKCDVDAFFEAAETILRGETYFSEQPNWVVTAPVRHMSVAR